MQTITLLSLLSVLFGSSCSTPIGIELFPGFQRNANLQAPQKEAEINKRFIVDPNRDTSLKQISLQSVIGSLEQSLFQSAISVSGVGQHDDQVVQEVTPKSTQTTTASTTTKIDEAPSTEHAIRKRSSIAVQDVTTSSVATSTPPLSTTITNKVSSTTEADHVLLQTTKKVPERDGVPAHILIDRVSIQPHNGQIPSIPTFAFQHTKVIEAEAKETNTAGPTEISITQTTFKATNFQPSKNEQTTAKTDSAQQITTVPAEESTDTQLTTVTTHENDNASTTAGAVAHDSTTTIATETSTTSTVKPIAELKHAEAELKEKVAEIEADPVILSARV